MSEESEQLLVWNGLVARVPALVIRPASPREVADAVAFARDHGLLVRIEGAEPAAVASERAVTLCFPPMPSQAPPPTGRPSRR